MSRSYKLPENFRTLSDHILNCANRGMLRVDFLREILKKLRDFSGCNTVELRLKEGDKYYLCKIIHVTKPSFRFKSISCLQDEDGKIIPCPKDNSMLEKICKDVFLGRFDPSLPFFTKKGSFWTGDIDTLLTYRSEGSKRAHNLGSTIGGDHKSFIVIPLVAGDENIGLLQFKSKRKNYFRENEIEFYEDITQTLGGALIYQQAQAALHERVKELNCLYGLSKLAVYPDISLEKIFQETIDLIPPAWQYPEITCARIVFEGREFKTDNFRKAKWKQRSDIKLNGKKAGSCEIYYLKEKPEIDEGPFLKEERALLNTIVAMLESIAESKRADKARRESEHALRERVKELTCLYSLSKLAERPGITLDEILKGIVNLLPPAWQYPEITYGRIILDGRNYSSLGFQEGQQKQSADIVVSGESRGVIEVIYAKEMPELDEGPFLEEERSLVDAIAKQVGLIIERRQAEEEKSRLQNQLRHADRLATIGQLSAGVAHELNEPLGNILGFAQLAKKSPGLTEQANQDIDKIITASLYAREVIKKLMLFTRQTPPRKTKVNLNEIVGEGISFFKSRASKEGIKIVCLLSEGLPEITADPGQLTQVLVNLVVNALQAMPEGGTLTIKTRALEDHVLLIVDDTGIGISEEDMKQIFLPFFTTKEIGQGTGLGLAVVHGIMTSHGGAINVESKIGRGTSFEIRLPVTGTTVLKEED